MKAIVRRRILQALSVAIDTAESWIDSETTALRIRDSKVQHYVGRESRANVSRYKRDIAAWRRCKRELSTSNGQAERQSSAS